jgi:acyl carrier protein
VFLDRLPLTANGKIDRRALPAPAPPHVTPPEAPARTQGGPMSLGPREEMERILIEVWAQALGVERVGTEQNVFDLGATSLMMAEVHAELERRLAREIPLVDLFEFHTVSAFAAHLVGASAPARLSHRGERRRAARAGEGPP